ncbi:Uncharacterized protein family UPF0311 [Penicillium expansum]|uniref:Uncharacterized protein family UPF0311 n=1 Tax=Penicillium expansum TaxID=27334 RepID=A0A0A2IUX0_PENEN|nr:Uncharacterized protein family UPF0311 [Penicillium expansum]KGO46907.1 Uncharacterized protein family UPF0311 [Penicillium expansum]KGO62325.1 Uncharacterized protein family UPF0311 [Penicillium expansum]KGO64003.1 Uncharacterized protein family UPF0311 [Penicillium expansum]
MGRTVDQEVHAAFVEFRAKEDDKKQHLLECPGLRGHPNAPQPSQPAQAAPNGIGPPNGYPGTPNGPTATPTGPTGPGTIPTPNGTLMTNGVNPHATPLQTPLGALQNRATMATPVPPTGPPSAPPSAVPSRPTPKPKAKTTSSSLPAPPLDDVHAAFVEFRAKEEDKCLSVQCIYCQQVRAKNTSRQRQHLLECPTYLSVMKDSIPANNLLHTFPEGDVARSLQIPAPSLELDFRMSIKMNPKVSVGPSVWGQREWVSFIGGQWAGRWGKGIVLPGGQDTQIVTKDSTTNLRASYILQTVDEPPAFIIVRTEGWLTGAKDVLEKVIDANMADGVNPGSYKYRVNLSMETGDERYTFLNTLMWIGSGCRRGHEVIFDSFRVN